MKEMIAISILIIILYMIFCIIYFKFNIYRINLKLYPLKISIKKPHIIINYYNSIYLRILYQFLPVKNADPIMIFEDMNSDDLYLGINIDKGTYFLTLIKSKNLHYFLDGQMSLPFLIDERYSYKVTINSNKFKNDKTEIIGSNTLRGYIPEYGYVDYTGEMNDLIKQKLRERYPLNYEE